MAPPSKNFTTLTYAFGSLLTAAKMTQLMDNTTHLEEWLGLSFTAAQDHDHDDVNSKALTLPAASVGVRELSRMREVTWQIRPGSILFRGSHTIDLNPAGGGTVTGATDADDSWVSFGSPSGTSHIEFESQSQTQGRHNPILQMRIKTDSDITERRMFFGLKENGSVISTDSTPDVELAAFRYATDVDGTAFWRCVSINGTGASAEETITSVAVAINTVYKLDVRVTSSQVEFRIDEVLVATHSSVVPDPSTTLEVTLLCKSLSGGARRVLASTALLVREA